MDTLRRDGHGRELHGYGLSCKIYTLVGDEWKMIAHTGLLEYPGKGGT